MKDTATQSGQFAACAFVLLFLAIEMFRQSRRSLAAGMLVVALIFLANILILARADLTIVPVAGLIIIPFLLILLGFKTLRAKAMFGLLAVGATMGAVAWVSSPQLRHATVTTWDSIQPYPGNHENPAGARPEFWKKSLRFICDAPAWGHGTGSIPGLFVRSAAGQTGYSARLTTDPLQQTLAVGIQLGLVGAAMLCAMWISHLLLFRGAPLRCPSQRGIETSTLCRRSKFHTARGASSPTPSVPILLGLALHRRSVRVLELEPVAAAAGGCSESSGASRRCLRRGF